MNWLTSKLLGGYVGLQDIAFFHPNFGEFWFEDKRRFPKWFTDAFFPRASYANALASRTSFTTMRCAAR